MGKTRKKDPVSHWFACLWPSVLLTKVHHGANAKGLRAVPGIAAGFSPPEVTRIFFPHEGIGMLIDDQCPLSGPRTPHGFLADPDQVTLP